MSSAAIARAQSRGYTEAELQNDVLRYAALCRWRAYHTHDSRRSAAGFPDLTLVRKGRIVFAELKTMTGRVTDDQQGWLDDLAAIHKVTAHLWRPDSWDEIEETLR